jgi:hypothetical protein
MSELARWQVIAATAAKDYRSLTSWWTFVSGVLSRTLLQAGFITMVGVRVAGSSRMVALTGAVAFIVIISTVRRAALVLDTDFLFETIDALRVGLPSVFAIALTRSWIWIAEGIGSAVFVMAVLGPPVVGWHAATRLLELAPLLLILAVATIGLGLTVAAVALVRDIDMLLGNVVAYLLLAISGVTTSSPDYLGRLFPLSHTIAALRLGMSDRPAGSAALTALGTGLPWLLVAVIMTWYLDRRLAVKGGTT